MLVSELELPGPKKIIPKIIADDRGAFSETYSEAWFRECIADVGFVQDNQSVSLRVGTIRGLHFQMPPFGQGKLVRCTSGAIFDVVVDIRLKSDSYGKWLGVSLNASAGEQLWVPEGFAHGFCTLEPNTIVSYKVTNYYSREHDRGVAFDDPDIGIEWPVDLRNAVLSDKDRAQPRLKDLSF